VAAVKELFGLDRFDVIAVNGAGWNYEGDIDYWISAHGGKLVNWMPRRDAAGGNSDYIAAGNFAPHEDNGPAIPLQRPNGGGSSGMFAVLFALEMGYRRCVLAGCPMSGNGREYYGDDDEGVMIDATTIDPQPEIPNGFAAYREGWKRQQREFAPHVRSMSGWTKNTFGAPTLAWLRS